MTLLPLLKKDIIAERAMLLIAVLLVAALTVFWHITKVAPEITFVADMFLMTFLVFMRGLDADESTGIRYALLAMPVSRSSIVAAKYIFGLVMVVGTGIFAFVVTYVASMVQGKALAVHMPIVLISAAILLVGLAVVLAFYYAFGYSGVRFTYILLLIILTGAIVLYQQATVIQRLIADWNKISNPLFLVGVAAATLAVFGGSFLVSRALQLRKDG